MAYRRYRRTSCRPRNRPPARPGDVTIPPVRILVCGGRTYNERAKVADVLCELSANRRGEAMTLIHGAAAGADKIAAECAGDLGWTIEAYKANWLRYGTSAGPIRNRAMIDRGKPDLVIAFPGGSGTEDMVARAEKAGIPVRRVT